MIATAIPRDLPYAASFAVGEDVPKNLAVTAGLPGLQPSVTTTAIPRDLPYAATFAKRRASVENLPVNLFGSVMGLSGLALAWRLAHTSFGIPQAIGEGIAALAVAVFLLLVAGYLAKWAKHPAAVAAEFNHPVSGNFFGTIAISILLLSAVVSPYSAGLGQAMWTVGAAVSFLLSFLVVSRLLKGAHDPAHAVPAWLIPGVATLDVAVTGASMPMSWAAEVNLAAMAIGTVLALVMSTMIFSRLVHHDALGKGLTPSLMVLVAPFAVGFLAYTNVFGSVDSFASLLVYFGLFLFIVLARKVFRRDVPFAPGWWAISFPLAALSNAALTYAAARDMLPLSVIAAVLLALLTVMIAVLTVRTLHIAVNGKLLSA